MGIEPIRAASPGLENKQFGQMADPPDRGHRRDHLPLQTATLFHRIMTARFDGVAYDSINRWATGTGRDTINERRNSLPASGLGSVVALLVSSADLHKGCVQCD
jgi:hypothetical protein